MSTAQRLFAVCGAGYAGALLANNGEAAASLAAAGSALLRTALHSLSRPPPGGGGGGGGGGAEAAALSALAVQVAHLSALVASRPLHGASSAPSLTGAGWAVAACAAGAAALRLRGVRPSDMLWCTRAGFRQGMAALGGGLASVSAAVAAVKAHLSAKLDALSGRVEDGLAAQAELAASLEGARSELEGLVQSVASLHDKADWANRGTALLCTAVAGALADGGGGGQGRAGQAAAAVAAAQPAGALEPASAAAGGAGAADVRAWLKALGSGAGQPGAAQQQPALLLPGLSVADQLAAIQQIARRNLELC